MTNALEKRNLLSAVKLLILFTVAAIMEAPAVLAQNALKGVGYREQELQIAKGSKFQTEIPEGIPWASFAGGTHIFIDGTGIAEAPTSNQILLESVEFGQTIPAPGLTEEDAFNSNTMLGSISYRLVDIPTLFGMAKKQFDNFHALTFYLTVKSTTIHGEEILECAEKWRCKIVVQKQYTPTIYYLSPPVTYYDSWTEVYFDPMNVPGLITNLDSDELQFINTKVGGNLLDFEQTLSNENKFYGYVKNHVRGQVGEGPVNNNQDVSMMWEVGRSDVNVQTSKHCNFDETHCYKAFNVPVIFSMSENTGYTTGGQVLTVRGSGFNSNKITATADGVSCVVLTQSRNEFTCRVQPKAALSVDAPTVGQHGVRRKFINSDTAFSIADIDTKAGVQKLGLHWESENSRGSHLGNKMSSWFVAPETTKVRFYLSCDDACNFDISKTADTKIDATAAGYKPLITGSTKGYRQYFDTVTPAAPAPAAPSQNVAGYLTSQLDKDILTVTNEIRMNPASFIPKLQAQLAKFSTDPATPNLWITGTGTNLMTQEGPAAVQEAIDYLTAITAPITDAMQWDQYAEFECKDLVTEQSPTQETGHDTPSGVTMSQRFAKYGQFVGTIGENIAYGKSVAEDIVLQLFVDDGVASRGHRTNIMKPEFKFLGSSSGGHGKYGSMTCIGYAAGFTSNGQYPLIAKDDPNAAPAAAQELGSVTEWISVEKGKHYHIQGYHYENTGGDHYTVSVEIEANTQTHHHTMKEVQDIKVETDVVLEKTLVTIDTPDNLNMILAFQNPVTLSSWATEKIATDCSASHFRYRVKEFYWNTYRSDITVVKTMIDAAGAATTDKALRVKNTYEITLLKMIADVSTN